MIEEEKEFYELEEVYPMSEEDQLFVEDCGLKPNEEVIVLG